MSVSPLRYKLSDDHANWLSVEEDTGLVTVRSSMDRESTFVKDDKYTVLVLAYDNGNVNSHFFYLVLVSISILLIEEGHTFDRPYIYIQVD